MGRNPKKDTYEMWLDSGKWPEIQTFIADCSRKLVTQREMCERLNIDEATFSRLKKKHPEIGQVMESARVNLKMDLMSAMYKKAVGFESSEEEQIIEDKGKGSPAKRKVTKITKQVPPDYKALLYLLTKHFGKDFSDHSEELKLAEQKMKQSQEEWNDGTVENTEDRDEANCGT